MKFTSHETYDGLLTNEELLQELAKCRDLFEFGEDMIPAIGDPLEVAYFVEQRLRSTAPSVLQPANQPRPTNDPKAVDPAIGYDQIHLDELNMNDDIHL